QEVAYLDVVDNNGGNLLGLKRLRGTDFRAANTYQEFYVDFDYTYGSGDAPGLEFRVGYRATANLWLDRIIVVSYPAPYATTAQWALSPGSGTRLVQAKFIDGAGNISADAVTSIVLGPTPTPTRTRTPTATPTPTPILTPEIWLPLITR
ncbi:MAG: hypothetical protein WCF84_08495, partial [Anaerolineae bacterium]